MKATTYSTLIMLCTGLFLLGCDQSIEDPITHEYPAPLVSYQRSKPSHFSVYIEKDGQVSRVVQSGPASESMVPVERDSFVLSEEQFAELEQLIEPAQVSLYLQDQGLRRTSTVMIESEDVSEYISIDEDHANSEATQKFISFFKSLEPAETEVTQRDTR